MESRRKPRPIGDLLQKYLEAAGLHEVAAAQKMAGAWKAAVSEKVVAGTRLMKVKDGVLHVGVLSSALLYELKGFQRENILARLRKQPVGYVKDVRFKLISPKTA